MANITFKFKMKQVKHLTTSKEPEMPLEEILFLKRKMAGSTTECTDSDFKDKLFILIITRQ